MTCREDFTARRDQSSRDGEYQECRFRRDENGCSRTHPRNGRCLASQHDQVVAIGSKRLPLEPARNGFDLEPRKKEHQLQLTATDNADGEFVHSLILELPLPTVELVEEAHLQKLRGCVVLGGAKALQRPLQQLAGEVMA